MSIENIFPKGIFHPDLFIGKVNIVSSNNVYGSLLSAYGPSGTFYEKGRYGKGEVGEFVIIEGQVNVVLGRLVEVKLIRDDTTNPEAVGRVQLLGSISADNLKVVSGIEAYPRLGDRIYSAPHQLIAMLPQLMGKHKEGKIEIELGTIDVALESAIKITPEKLFGRHLAILGTTGGGKSWTTANIIEQAMNFNSKLILLDATGEYRNIGRNDSVKHVHLSSSTNPAEHSMQCSLPPEA